MNLEVDEICFKSIQLQELHVHSWEESFQTEIEYMSVMDTHRNLNSQLRSILFPPLNYDCKSFLLGHHTQIHTSFPMQYVSPHDERYNNLILPILSV